MRALTKTPNPLLFSIILVMSIVGFAASLSVQNVEKIGSGHSPVYAPPVEVTGADWLLDPTDPRYAVKVDLYMKSIGPSQEVHVYLVLKGPTGEVLYTGHVGPTIVDGGLGIWSHSFIFPSPIPVEQIASLTVTVTQA